MCVCVSVCGEGRGLRRERTGAAAVADVRTLYYMAMGRRCRGRKFAIILTSLVAARDGPEESVALLTRAVLFAAPHTIGAAAAICAMMMMSS